MPDETPSVKPVAIPRFMLHVEVLDNDGQFPDLEEGANYSSLDHLIQAMEGILVTLHERARATV